MTHQTQVHASSRPNFRALFGPLPGLHLLLTLDFSIVAVSDA
jgi:hypothetical protein